MLIDFFKGNHFSVATATMQWLWGTWRQGHCRIDTPCKQGGGSQVMDASVSPKTSLLKMGKEMEAFNRSQVWPRLRLTRFLRLSSA
jgi:hypothetical protein